MSARMTSILHDEIAKASSWDQSNSINRRWLRTLHRRLWWSRYGTYVSAAGGGVLGGLIGISLANIFLGPLT